MIFFRLIYKLYVVPILQIFLPLYTKIHVKINTVVHHHIIDFYLHFWKYRKDRILVQGKTRCHLTIDDVGLTQAGLQLLKKCLTEKQEVTIAQIDQDGFLLPEFGPISDVPCISEDEFLVRTRFALSIVALKTLVAVKKHFRLDKHSFFSELKALHLLEKTGCNVPPIVDIDIDRLTLTTSYIQGSVLREELAKKGALLRDHQIDNNPDVNSLSPMDKWMFRINEGKRFLHDVVDSQFIEELFAEIKKVHSAGFILDDIKYGNIIIEKNSCKPFLIDFDCSKDFSYLGKCIFRFICDSDIEKFNLHFDTQKHTYKSIKNQLTSKKSNITKNWHTPIYLGAGLAAGSFQDLFSLYHCIKFIKKQAVRSLPHTRILEIGAGNAAVSLELLRQGFAEAIGIESDNKYIAQGNFVKEALEWADNMFYNFQYIHADVNEIKQMELGKFDLVIFHANSKNQHDDRSLLQIFDFAANVSDVFVILWDTKNTAFDKNSVKNAVNIISKEFPATKLVSSSRHRFQVLVGNTQSQSQYLMKKLNRRPACQK